MVGSSATLKTAAPRAIHAPSRQSKAENPQNPVKGEDCASWHRDVAPGRGRALEKFLESGINFGNFDALEAGLPGIVTIFIRGRQDALGVPDDADMISFREPELPGRSAKGDQGQFQGVGEMQRRGVDRDDAVQLPQTGDERRHGRTGARYESSPHLFRKPGAQRLLKPG